ncbi:unnamed protein product [Paramecium pentaurelia]|uniref:Uncharacterized protein n=1 Tax=Paramecium pentaurelia TaxID=43138 RepID=A0A8S1XCI8_9CILI|nr:unnamed protein product [Paramecium pentaurelia]
MINKGLRVQKIQHVKHSSQGNELLFLIGQSIREQGIQQWTAQLMELRVKHDQSVKSFGKADTYAEMGLTALMISISTGGVKCNRLGYLGIESGMDLGVAAGPIRVVIGDFCFRQPHRRISKMMKFCSNYKQNKQIYG